MKTLLSLASAFVLSGALYAVEAPTYTLGTPRPATVRLTTNAGENAWLAANEAFVATAGYAAYAVTNAVTRRDQSDGAEYRLASSEAGFSWERSKPEYYLSDRVDAPADVDWNATYDLYADLRAEGRERGFLFNPNAVDPCVYAIAGGNQEFSWVLKDGTTNTMTYVVGMSCSGRPRRIYWTDSPYNAPPISLVGKFVKFMGNDELLTLRYATVTNVVGGVSQIQENKVVSGLYVDPQAQVLYAAGELSGQCVMVYYDTGNYENILAVQVVEVRRPEAVQLTGEIGRALAPSGQGYGREGLKASVSTGIGDATDNRGDYLYQHKGSYSYSKKNGDVFPLRPTVGSRWLASVYWMETDAMGVNWPFEYAQYENDWPEDAQLYVRGDLTGADGVVDYGAKIRIDSAYTATLESYQEPEGHAKAVTGDNYFHTEGAGWSMLRLTANDNVWFLPIHSVMRSDTNLYSLASSRVTVGREVTLRSGTRSGTTEDAMFFADPDVPGYLYKAGSGPEYDVNLYRDPTVSTATNSASASGGSEQPKSAIFPIAAHERPLEVWWSEKADLDDDAPADVTVPVLPQVSQPVWPDPGEMPQIVIASCQGSANETVYQQHGAACFDDVDACIAMADRRYFPTGSGTISFWTRPQAHNDARDDATNAPSALLSLGSEYDDWGWLVSQLLNVAVDENECLSVLLNGEEVLNAPMPALAEANDWTHVAISFSGTTLTLYLDGEEADTAQSEDVALLGDYLEDSYIGADLGEFHGGFANRYDAAVGREIAEVVLRSRALTVDEIREARYQTFTGAEANLTGYYTFRQGVDLVPYVEWIWMSYGLCVERVHGEACEAFNAVFSAPGAPAKGTGVLAADESPAVYRQNDPEKPGYNPNEEHAFVNAGSGGYVTWALRCDLNAENAPPPAVLVEYVRDGKSRMQFFEVVLTNSVWPTLSGSCTAGSILPGPHPLDLFENPWLPQDTWDATADGCPGVAYRDRKGQIWARAAGTLGMRMYYAMQDGFDFPSLPAARLPAVGTPIPWLACLGKEAGQDDNPLSAAPAVWTWNVSWPEVVPEMKIGQTLTLAAEGLPEVWGAKSLSVVYPDPGRADEVAMLTDPTVVQSEPFDDAFFPALGLSTDRNGGLALKGGKYYFTELPPHLSSRLYVDATNKRLCFKGERRSSAAGVSVLYPNVLSSGERRKVMDLVAPAKSTEQPTAYKAWEDAVMRIASHAVRPNAMSQVDTEIFTRYSAVDHYALTAMGGTNYVTLIENDATNAVYSVGGVPTRVDMGVADGDPIGMKVLRVVPEYYTGRIVTREDEVNLLSQQLSVIYTESFAGEADDYVFEWRSAPPAADGKIPSNYDGGYQRRYDPDLADLAVGNTRITIGEQGDTLANMVNRYWICRYRAKDATCPAYPTMSTNWSAWCAPPALAEGWIQRVLNNITPFNQRMTDLYENAAETPISMIQIAGRPYTGDVALNQDNLTSVGLIELYETLLNKAESLSLAARNNNMDANKQLLLAAGRLHDLYALLGDEAYCDAQNPTIGIGSNRSSDGDNQPEVDFESLGSALFCFDNQVPTLLDEELALLRGRTGESAPSTTLAPYYNRLVWNFTKGITAGEVAYAMNYNIEGSQTVTLGEEQAATLYPQGHGDAYGHYLSALKGWYRLIRNPYFSWPVAQGEMVVADAAANVDYYEERKFAEAAAKIAKVAAECTDLTARKAWRDNGGTAGTGYLDADADRAFGYGEWASRGGYGALVNWVTANTLLPPDAATDDETAFDELYDDEGLARIDRGTVDELVEICTQAESIQRSLDALDAGLNPLGLSDGAIPFDITPIGLDDGDHTHYEQIRERAGTALSNARKVLERAQGMSNRLRLLRESEESFANAVATTELDYNNELIGYYGTPYSDDIGPGKTYAQDYDGPDLIHYMWMDLSKFGLTDVEDVIATNVVYYSGVHNLKRWYNVVTALGNKLTRDIEGSAASTAILFETSANKLIVKPASITGSRRTQGSIQEKYAEFLQQYAELKVIQARYKGAREKLDIAEGYDTALAWRYLAVFGFKETMSVLGIQDDYSDAGVKLALNMIEYCQTLTTESQNQLILAIPQIVGVGMTVNSDPRAFANAAASTLRLANVVNFNSAKTLLKNTLITDSLLRNTAEHAEEIASAGLDYYEGINAILEDLQEKAQAVTEAHDEYLDALSKLNVCVEAYNAEVAKAEAVRAKREADRKVQVARFEQARYYDMFFRLQRSDALTRYRQSFALAQRYAFLAAQAYDYETALLSTDAAAGDAFKAKIVGARALGAFDDDGEPIVGGAGDAGLAGALAQMDANWLVLKPRLGINNPQPYATWFSLRGECFRILPDEEGDAAWAKELTKHWVDDIRSDPEFIRFCQPFQSQFGLPAKEPGLVIPFETTIDFAKNLFGRDLAGGDSAYDSSWHATRIAAAGVWFDGYNAVAKGSDGTPQLANTPVAYLVPVGRDRMRVPGLDDGTVMQFSVVDQVVPLPFAIGSTHLDDLSWVPSMLDGDLAGADGAAKIRRHPSFRVGFDSDGGEPSDDALDATRLAGRSVWNTRWLLVIPAGAMNADREKALSIFINGSDQDRDGKLDLLPVSDIRIGFKTYSNSGN